VPDEELLGGQQQECCTNSRQPSGANVHNVSVKQEKEQEKAKTSSLLKGLSIFSM